MMDTFYKKLFVLMALVLYGHYTQAQEEVSKQLRETYEMTNSGELYLENKYGDVTITGWDRDNVSITVDITVTHRKLENAKNLLDRISLNIREIEDFITVTSEIAEKNTGFFARYFNKANPFDFDRSNVQIDYTIQLPENAELDITNKFGDVIIGDWSGKLKATVEHGDVWVNEDINNADVILRYGKLRTKTINYGNIRVKNGSVDIEESKDLRINSSGTDIEIDRVSSLEIYSSKDEITIGEVGAVNGDLRFTNMQLNTIEDLINLTMKIADFRVSNVRSPDATLVIDQESSEVSLTVSDFSFRFDATLEEGLLRLPKSFKNVETKMLNKGQRIREITATYGKGLAGEISITGIKGVILLKEF
ncbi:hypothetical protein [Ulvibacterium sp.]|uniref:hypothetical protein n=1 Tax=Ulvibacterium sp. TaxID=2665914 RepID=UPI003BAB5B6F